MGSVGKKIKKVVKKVMRPKVLLPLAALAIGGPMLAGKAGGFKAALLGKAGAAGTAGGALIPISKASALAQGVATPGLFGAGGVFNPFAGTVAKGIMAGLKNPLSLKGAATYGGLAAAAGLLGGGDKPRPGSDVTGAKAQSMYDSFLQSGRMAGYTDDEINTIFAPYGDMYAGDYQTVRSDPRRREVQFPGTNYPLYVANGGRIGYNEGDLVAPEQELDDEELQKMLLREALFPKGSPGANEDAMAEQMYNMQMQEMMSPRMGRAGGGIMQVAPGVPAGMELDYRNTGGFIPMGGPEKADDVPAMLSRNEFVMTADAVRGMGDGDVNAGAQKMYDLMNNLEAKA
jgi:hypothetical protein